MTDRWASATGSYSLRFFSPEEIDQILREGVKRGRTGSHAAIDRILKHEPRFERAQLWRRIRRLKQPSRGKLYQRTAWSSEDDQILRKGYAEGWKGKRDAVRRLVMMHPGWQPHSIWSRAARLGLVPKNVEKTRLRSRQPWTEDDDRILLTMAGYKTAKFISKALQRSESAVRYRLAVLGKSSRVHLEGYARRTLAQELHLGSRTIQRLIVQGLLDVRDPRITQRSLKDACTTGLLPASAPSGDPAPGASFAWSKSPRSSRAKRIWADVARQHNTDANVIEQLIFRGVLKLHDPRVTEKSLTKFCVRYGALIKTDFLDAETRIWLTGSMDLSSSAGKEECGAVESLRKHALIVRICEHCRRAIRGNVFFRHNKLCPERNNGDTEGGLC